MKYLVTGATGFIGAEVARRLLGAGHHVVALVRSPGRAQALRAQGAELALGDVTDPDSVRRAMTGADGVFHLAAWYKVGVRDDAAEAVNVGGTRHVLEAMRDLGVPRGVYTSSLAVFSDTGGRVVDETYRYDGPFLTAYERLKWRAHYEVALPMMAEGLPLVIVQPGPVYGPGDTSQLGAALKQYLQGKMPLLPLGTAFSWGYIDDIAEAHLLAMERGAPGESYIIGGPNHTLVEAFTLAERLAGKRIRRVCVPPGLLRGLARASGALERALPLPAEYTAEGLRSIAGTTYTGDDTKARRALGFDPRPLEEGLRRTVDAMDLEAPRR